VGLRQWIWVQVQVQAYIFSIYLNDESNQNVSNINYKIINLTYKRIWLKPDYIFICQKMVYMRDVEPTKSEHN